MTDYEKERKRVLTAIANLSHYGIDPVSTIVDKLERLDKLMPFEEAYRQLEEYYRTNRLGET